MRVFPHLCACEKRKAGCLATNQTTAASPGPEAWRTMPAVSPSSDTGVSNGPRAGNSLFSKYGGATFSSRRLFRSAPILVQDQKPPPTPNSRSRAKNIPGPRATDSCVRRSTLPAKAHDSVRKPNGLFAHGSQEDTIIARLVTERSASVVIDMGSQEPAFVLPDRYPSKRGTTRVQGQRKCNRSDAPERNMLLVLLRKNAALACSQKELPQRGGMLMNGALASCSMKSFALESGRNDISPVGQLPPTSCVDGMFYGKRRKDGWRQGRAEYPFYISTASREATATASAYMRFLPDLRARARRKEGRLATNAN